MRTTGRVAIGVAGAVLVIGSLVAQSVVSAGSKSSAAQTRVCLGKDYSLLDGCSVATHEFTPPEFGRAYVVTDVGEREGVDQYELLYQSADGTMQQIAVRQTTTGKVPRYVLFLADLTSTGSGPPRAGRYELVTSSGGQQSSYALTVIADNPGPPSTSAPATTSPSPTAATASSSPTSSIAPTERTSPTSPSSPTGTS